MIHDNQTAFPHHYLSCLRPFANDKAILLTAPSALAEELSEMARLRHTTRLDLIRYVLSRFIEGEGCGKS